LAHSGFNRLTGVARSSQPAAAKGWAIAAGGLMILLLVEPGMAAESNSADKPSEQSESKSPPANKPDDKPGSHAEQKADSKPDDPCDQEKLLLNFEARHRLCEAGVQLGVTETSEILGNLTGGLRQGARYEGVTDLNLKINLRPGFHVRGEIFARAYQIHGRGLTADNIGNLNLASSIEAARATRLSELWY
jgi:porin